MSTLQGEHIVLRALEPTDLELLFQLENDESVWEISNTTTPYSKFVLKQYLDNAHRDIYEIKQLRLVICVSKTTAPIGFIDVFDFDPKNRRAGVGVVVFSHSHRQKGYAAESLKLLCNYARVHLDLHQLYANITEDNIMSIRLFEKAGFLRAGIKKDWIAVQGSFKNELLYQYIYE